MADTERVVINLATGLEDGERVTVALLVAVAALEQGRPVTTFLTKQAVHIALPSQAAGIACDGCPPIPQLLKQYADAGGELLVCPICFNARKLDVSQLAANARMGGATPLWESIGGEHATVFSY